MFSHIGTQRLFLNEILDPREHEIDVDDDVRPGDFLYDKELKVVFIKCASDTWIGVKEFRLEQKRPMTAADFWNGYGERDIILGQ